MIRKDAATRVNTNCPPRPVTSRCGSNNIAAVGKKQLENLENKIVDINKGNIMNVAVRKEDQRPAFAGNFTNDQINILKNSICKGVTNDEFEVFLMACVKTQLDPFMRQIYAVKRKTKKPDGSWGETMTIQTGIDGYRLIAERTERYAPADEPTYNYDINGNLISATAYIKKQTRDGTWHTVSASGYIDEYCQTFVDKSTGEKRPTGMWATMPRTMLAKCAEAQALRKAFPAEMSGVYTKEEMQQADDGKQVDNQPQIEIQQQQQEEEDPFVTVAQAETLKYMLDDCEPGFKTRMNDYLHINFKIDSIENMTFSVYKKFYGWVDQHLQKYRAQQRKQVFDDLPYESEML